MRIGVDASNLRQGGGRTHLIELLQAADPMRDQFDTVVVWGSRQTLDLLEPRPWLEKVAVSALEKGLVSRLLWQWFSLGKVARAEGCQILFIPGGSFTTDFRPVVTMSRNMLPFEWREARRFGMSLTTLKLLLLRLAMSRAFRQADGVIFLTDYAKQHVLSVTGSLKGLSSVIPHGLNSRFLVSDQVIRERRIPGIGEKVCLIYVSIINQYKHQWYVVEAVARARSQTGVDFQLDLVGSSYAPALRKLNAAIAAHDPEGRWVRYRGPVAYQELHSYYAQAHIGIFASSCENMPNILLEIMAAGLPILSSNRGPMPEILGDAGWYFDPERPQSLCDALVELIQCDEMSMKLACAAREKAKTYSWERCSEQTFAFLRQVHERTIS